MNQSAIGRTKIFTVIHIVGKNMRKLGIILIFILLLVSGCNSSGYDAWKDTLNVYGDGTYVKYHGTYDRRSIYGINNTLCNQSVVEEILSEKTDNEKIYIYGMFYPYKVYDNKQFRKHR